MRFRLTVDFNFLFFMVFLFSRLIQIQIFLIVIFVTHILIKADGTLHPTLERVPDNNVVFF